MPFTNATLLKRNLGSSIIDSFVSAHAEVLNELINQADAIITRASGIQPPSDPAAQSGNEQLLTYAAWIVKYLMIDHLGIKDRDEIDHRAADYERAVKALTGMQGETGGSTYEVAAPQQSSTARVGEIL